MTKSDAVKQFRAELKYAIDNAKWNGLTEAEVAAILAGESIR